MAVRLPADRTEKEAHELFYPGQSEPYTEKTSKRRVGFLSSLDRHEYWEIYCRILKAKSLRFPDVHRITRLSRDEGRVLYLIMSHVVAWLNAEPTKIIDRRDNNKPPLRKDLAPALEHCPDKSIREAERRLGMAVLGTEQAQTKADAASILMQKEVLDFVLYNMAAFKSREQKDYLAQLPKDVGNITYAERFSHNTWARVLSIVRKFAGNSFRPDWATTGTSQRNISTSDLPASFSQFMNEKLDLAADSSLRKKLESQVFQEALIDWFSQVTHRHDNTSLAHNNERDGVQRVSSRNRDGDQETHASSVRLGLIAEQAIIHSGSDSAGVHTPPNDSRRGEPASMSPATRGIDEQIRDAPPPSGQGAVGQSRRKSALPWNDEAERVKLARRKERALPEQAGLEGTPQDKPRKQTFRQRPRAA